MKRNRSRGLLWGGMAVALGAFQCSCSTSSSAAWNRIQTEGLIPYIVEKSSGKTPGEGYDSDQVVAPQPRFESYELDDSGVVTAHAVEGKLGFVYSPHTTALLEVDVRDFQAGERVLCPYTKRAFRVPGAGESILTPAQSEMGLVFQPALPPSIDEGVQTDFALIDVLEANSEPPPTLVPSKDEILSEVAAAEEVAVDLTPIAGRIPRDGNRVPSLDDLLAQPVKEKIKVPVGTPVPGKPNYVLSPFAARNQVVDIEGLAPGTKVKCPYTGKIFAVPGSDLAPVEAGDREQLAD